MTTKAYIVSWLGKGKITWKPISQNDLSNVNLKDAVNLSQSMLAISCELQIVNIAFTVKSYLLVKEIQRDVKEIKGKFEILFLDKSIDYFIDCHQNMTGIIPSVLFSLERDVFISLQSLVENRNLDVPSYLDHKISVLASTLKSWNEVLYATIHNGAIPKHSNEHIQLWIERIKNIANRSPDGGYVDQALVLTEWGKFIQNQKEEKSWFGAEQTLMEKAISKENFNKCKSHINLAREIQYSAELFHSLEDKLCSQAEPIILIKTA
jgi:hypothetical protein